MSTLEIINKEINTEISKPEIANQLLNTTFKGLSLPIMKEAIMAGMLRGFTFKDFLEKNIYAISYGSSYSLITSIDYARKIGMRSGVVGISAPTYTYSNDNKSVQSCSVTVKRKVGEYVGEYTATVEFSEYSTGRNLWTSKPKTMIAKVAEMHALRKACPEELSQAYVEEEKAKETKLDLVLDTTPYKDQLEKAKDLNELKAIWIRIPAKAQVELEVFKNELKSKYENS